MKDIPEDVLAVLSAAEMEGPHLRLTGQLNRKLYTDTNKVLTAAGGKWNRKAKAHVFDGEAEDAMEPLLLTGSYATTKQDFGQFDTPTALAARVAEMASIHPNMRVLEPSAGIGRLVEAAADSGALVDAIEIDAKRAEKLINARASTVTIGDFLEEETDPSYDRVVMNPPFAKGADTEHVRYAYEFLKPGGRLVAIMSPGFTFRNDRKHMMFREWVEGMGGTVEHLPENSFKESGTSVNTVILVIDKAPA